tara:strand:- start:3012 stop:3242 length:231 start_codon:yes stop_codon:yes gene_type:complete
MESWKWTPTRRQIVIENKNIIIVLEDGETYSGAGAIVNVSDEAMGLLEEGVKFKHLYDELEGQNWCEVIQEVGSNV